MRNGEGRRTSPTKVTFDYSTQSQFKTASQKRIVGITGYDSPEAVLRRILDEHYDTVVLRCPNTKLIAEYLVLVANSVAIGLSSGWGNDVENLNEVVKQLIMNGIVSQCYDTDDGL